MTRTGGNIPTAGAIRTGGKMSAGKLTGAMLRKTLQNHLHPQLEADMQGAGLFDKLSGIINMGNIKRLYGAVDKAIPLATKGFSAYKDIKKGIDGMKKKDDEAMIMPTLGMSYGVKGAGLKSKRKLPDALRERAEFLGEQMRNGHSMKQASDMYKARK
jgi:hypothetical protein